MFSKNLALIQVLKGYHILSDRLGVLYYRPLDCAEGIIFDTGEAVDPQEVEDYLFINTKLKKIMPLKDLTLYSSLKL